MRGEFPAGSMGPKVEAALAYLEAGGKRAIITAPESIALALGGSEGTEVLPPLGVMDDTMVVG
jgi:carbamate kinase